MSLSEDSYDFEDYVYWEGEGPPLIKKKSRILAYVVQNDVEGLRLLLDSPKWYKVRDKYGYNILQIAILRENKEIFDYLMSLKDFPVDEPCKTGETALEIALTAFVSNDIFLNDYYAYKLLERDVKIDAICLDGNTLLHCAFERSSIRSARLLIEKGADVNALNNEDYTPMHMCLFYCDDEDLVQGVTLLLSYKADPLIRNSSGISSLELVMMQTSDVFLAQTLFNYVFDQYTHLSIEMDVLLQAAQNKWPLFREVIEKVSEVYCDNLSLYNASKLFSIDTEYLTLFMDKFDYAIEMVLLILLDNQILYSSSYLFSIANLDMLINSKFKSDAIGIVCNMNSTNFINYLIKNQVHHCDISKIVCYLLSYGMVVEDRTFEIIYKHFKCNDLFKMLLHMDIKHQCCSYKKPEIIPALFYNVKTDIDSYVQNPRQFSTEAGIYDLLSYSAHFKLKQLCYELDDEDITAKVESLPNIPHLVELARNVFRKYFIKKFNITTSRQFYTLLKFLPINEVYKKIISYETKLYY